MKKVILPFLIASLISGCNRLTDSASPACVVAVSEESNPIPESSKAPATEPTFTPNPTPEPNDPAPALPDNVASSSWLSWHWWFPAININNSIAKYVVNIGIYALAVIAGGYRFYRFVNPKFIPVIELDTIILSEEKAILEGYKRCCNVSGIKCWFDSNSSGWIEERPVLNFGVLWNIFSYSLIYKPNPSKLKPLKTWLRKKLKMPVSCL